MAPYPEEVDVFTVPHSRMKELVNDYAEMIKKTNFTNDMDLTLLLESLLKTFMEFKTHEQIENQFIMKKLKNKLKQLSIKNTAVCNCHKDDQLGQMMNFIKAGYKKKTAQDRINFGLKLEKALEDFTCTFIPHMQEEEEVFQPLLLQYFSYEELRDLKKKVIQQHIDNEQALIEQQLLGERGVPDGAAKEAKKEEKGQEDDDQTEGDDYCKYMSSKENQIDTEPLKNHVDYEEKDETCYMDELPIELKLRIFSYLKPPELAKCAKVNHDWNRVAMDPTLWTEIYPVHWAQGQWICDEDCYDEMSYEDDISEEDNYMVIDDDADVDESEQYEDTECSNLIQQVKKEADVLRGLMKYLLPKTGKCVKKLVLQNSRALTNGMLNKMVQACPNLEYLDVSQTRTSDAGLKRLGRNGCGSKLKKLILSGCVNITDATLVRLAVALHQSAPIIPLKYDSNIRKENVNQTTLKKGMLKNDPAPDSGIEVSSDADSQVIENTMTYEVTQLASSGTNQGGSLNPCDVNEIELITRDGDRYDLDCLCEMYYNECHIEIKGGCDIATHHCNMNENSHEIEPAKENCNGNTFSSDEVADKYGKNAFNSDRFKTSVTDGKEGSVMSNQSCYNKNSTDMNFAKVENQDKEKVYGKDDILNHPKAPDESNGQSNMASADLCYPKSAHITNANEINGSVAPNILGNDICIQNKNIKWEEVHKVCHTVCHAKGEITEFAIEDCIPLTSAQVNSELLRDSPLIFISDRTIAMTNTCDDSILNNDGSDISVKTPCSVLLNYGLEHLNLSGCFQITDIGLGALGKIGRFPKMKHLDLSGCLRISAEGLQTLVDACPNLQPYQLYYCDNIVDGPFADTASGCQNLECNSRVCCRSGE